MRQVRLATTLACSLALSACAAPMAMREPASTGSGAPLATAPPVKAPLVVGIAAFNDFHGNIEPPHQSVIAPDGKGGTVQVPAGGAAWLASAIDMVRAKYVNHLTLSAGDMIGASGIASSLFLDEPTIGVMNRIGVDFNAPGNHEFDKGPYELKRMAYGGCARFTTRQPCALEPYGGAKFPFLTVNTVTTDGKTLFPGSALKTFGTGADKLTIGIIGATLKGTGDLVSPSVNAGIHWVDEADAINAAVPALKAAGADTIVLLLHQGGRTKTEPPAVPDPNRCEGFYGDVQPILDRLDPAIEVVISGHTHWAYICDHPVAGHALPGRGPRLLTSAGLYGEMVTDIALGFDPDTHKLTSATAHNLIAQSPGYTGALGPVAQTELYPRFAPREDIATYVKRYADAAGQLADTRIGWLSGAATRPDGRLSNTGGPLGKLIADSQLAATRGAGVRIAFMNPFGIRASLIPASDGGVSYGAAYAVEPFSNRLVTISLTGAQLKAVLEQCFDGVGPEQVLTPSDGFTYSYDRSRPVGNRIAKMTLTGRPIDPARVYRVSVSEFLAKGGDSFSGFTAGIDSTTGPLDLDALVAWLKPLPPRKLPLEARDIDIAPALDAEDPNRISPPGLKR